MFMPENLEKHLFRLLDILDLYRYIVAYDNTIVVKCLLSQLFLPDCYERVVIYQTCMCKHIQLVLNFVNKGANLVVTLP